MDNSQPYIVEFPKIGSSELGYISVAEHSNLPFLVKRIYWTYYTPEDVERGGHAHHHLEQLLVAVAGRIIVTTETAAQKKERFILESPQQGLYIPKFCWRTMRYSHSSVQMCIASMEYDEKDYIRKYEDFTKLSGA